MTIPYFEKVVYESLERMRVDFKHQFSVGPYRIDFWINHHFGLEVDERHHLNIAQFERDMDREFYLREQGYPISARLDQALIQRWRLAAEHGGGIGIFDAELMSFLRANEYDDEFHIHMGDPEKRMALREHICNRLAELKATDYESVI